MTQEIQLKKLQAKLETVFGKPENHIGDVCVQYRDNMSVGGFRVFRIRNHNGAVDILYSGTKKEINAWIDGILFVKANLGKHFMSWVFNNNDFLLVGNTYDVENIQALCKCTKNEARHFIDEVERYDDGVLENATINLEALFQNWKDEREQECN